MQASKVEGTAALIAARAREAEQPPRLLFLPKRGGVERLVEYALAHPEQQVSIRSDQFADEVDAQKAWVRAVANLAADADPAAQASAEAARLKAKGNSCFNNGCYVDAWENYSDAIDCLAAAGVAGRAEDAKLHTNRAACLLTADRWVPAAHDGARAISLDAEWWKGYWYRGQALLGQLKGKRPSKVMQQKAEVALKALERASQCRGFPEDKRERVEQLQARARNIVFYLAQNQCPTQ